jgi:hypothetical protein
MKTGAAQDFRLEDAALELRSPYVSVNGEGGASVIPTGTAIAGPVVWFYQPDHGRFILSMIPRPDLGLVKAGEIRGTTLTFNAGTDTYNLVSAERIAPGQHPFNLYVLHEPEWRPRDGEASVWAGGAANTPEELIRK